MITMMALAFPVYEVSQSPHNHHHPHGGQRYSSDDDGIRVTSTFEVSQSTSNAENSASPHEASPHLERHFIETPPQPLVSPRGITCSATPQNPMSIALSASMSTLPRSPSAAVSDQSHVQTLITGMAGTSSLSGTCCAFPETHGSICPRLLTANNGPAIAASENGINDDKPRSKVKIFDMLSAIDRKKKKSLPKRTKNQFQALQGLTPFHMVAERLPLTTILAPLTEDFVPVAKPRSDFPPRKLEPRGADERQDFSELQAFLGDHRSSQEERKEVYGPKSHFDWGDSDDEGVKHDMKVSKTPLRSKTRATERKVAGSGDGNGGTARVTKHAGVPADLVDQWIASTGVTKRRGNSEDLDRSGITRTISNGFRRGSVFKVFDDPVWNSKAGGKLNVRPGSM